MVEIFTSSFSSNLGGTSVDKFIKWNNDNCSCVILNVDDSCLAKLGAASEADLSIHATPPEGMLDLIRNDSSETFFLRE
ncbi:hypothetical protein A2U01_0031953 [Trifolium medium]|uniref:Uncharacterized protein n=1 Tax=Trifolium medium TaxID=97028 RepID=A0A392PGU4_9FABA|nr:hypothetical protein [Trifolium medium]